MTKLIDAQLQQALNPPPPAPDPLVELRRMEVLAKIRAENSRIQVEYIRAQAEIARAANDARLAESQEAKTEAEAILALAKAAAAEMGNQYQQYKQQLDELERQAATHTQGLAESVIANASATQIAAPQPAGG
jgi:propanediol dehydratase small subunit